MSHLIICGVIESDARLPPCLEDFIWCLKRIQEVNGVLYPVSRSFDGGPYVLPRMFCLP